MKEKFLLISGRAGIGKTQILISYANQFPHKTLIVSEEYTKENIIKKGLNSTVMVTNQDNFKNIIIDNYDTICLDYIELFDKNFIEKILSKVIKNDIRIVAVTQMKRGDFSIGNNIFKNYFEATKKLEDIFNNTVMRYENSLRNFRPSKSKTHEFLEQNLLTNFAIEFSTKYPTAKIYSEVPFISDMAKNHWTNRLDMYIENNNIGFLIEAKGSLSGDALFEGIDKDIKRIKSKEIQESFKKMYKNDKNKMPKRFYGIIIADCWSKKNETINKQAIRWKNYKKELNSFKNILKLNQTFSKEVKLQSDYKYHILFSIFDIRR